MYEYLSKSQYYFFLRPIHKKNNITACPCPPETSINAVLDAIGELDGGIHYANSKGVIR